MLRELATQFPIPSPGWHGYVETMLACRRDFDLAIAAIEADPAAAAALDRLVSEEDALPEAPPDGAVGAALARLDALPRPDGQHPFLPEIEPALDAMRAALHAVAASPGAASRFGATLPS
jgi:hypothetical protein